MSPLAAILVSNGLNYWNVWNDLNEYFRPANFLTGKLVPRT